MKALAAVMVGLLALSLVFDAEARRLGGSRNLGTQRQAVTPQQPAPKAPAQQQAVMQAVALALQQGAGQPRQQLQPPLYRTPPAAR